MCGYDGISQEGMWLLAQNRFENSRDFYEAHKEEIKAKVLVPMKQIAECLLEDMYKYDNKMVLIPSKMISRVRRDTRYSKDKTLYRENVWMMFMRPKKENPFVPCFWFEIFPDRYSCGVGFYDSNARLMELFRRKMAAQPVLFRKLVKQCLAAGAAPFGEKYKKVKQGNIPDDLKDYLNYKYLFFRADCSELSHLSDRKIIDVLREYYKAFYPMYQFLLDICIAYESERTETIC